ncbi:hypothetical protein [Campylobacter troglodytis]|nr:hypothetical protein [Campylobacter troglodytis]
MSGEMEVDKNYFLLPYTRNCVVEVVRRVCNWRWVGKKTPVFLLR